MNLSVFVIFGKQELCVRITKIQVTKIQSTPSYPNRDDFQGKPGCLGESSRRAVQRAADHYATVADIELSDQNLIRRRSRLLSGRKNCESRFPDKSRQSTKVCPATRSAGEEFLGTDGGISRLHALNTLAGHSRSLRTEFYNRKQLFMKWSNRAQS